MVGQQVLVLSIGVRLPDPEPRKMAAPPRGAAILSESRVSEAILRDLTSKIMYYVYLIESQNDKSWYIGYSSDLKRRINDHQKGYGSRTTSLKSNWKLIYYEAYIEKQDAIGREKFLKSGSGRKYLNKQLKNYLLKK